MDEQEQRVPALRRRSRAEAVQLAAAYEASGLSRIEFCRKQGLGLATLYRYLKWWRAAGAGTTAANLIAVELGGERASVSIRSQSGLVVALASGRRIEVARGFDAPTLVQLLGLLERF